MSLTLPSAGINPGASADRRTQGVDVGAEVARFGDTMQRVGFALRDQDDERAFSRAQLAMLEQFNQLELDMAQIGDPAAMDEGFRARAPGVMGSVRPTAAPILDTATAGLAPDVLARLRPRLDEAYERIRIGAAQGVGRSALALRQSAQIEDMGAYRAVSLNTATAPNASPEMRLLTFEAFSDHLDTLVANGTITPEQRGAQIQGWARDEAETRARGLLAEAPQTLLAQLDTDDFAALPPENRATLRAQATARLDTATREASAALGQRLREGIAVVRAGYDYEAADALAADPAVAAHPDGPEFIAALSLHRARPDLARMTPAQQAALLREAEAAPIGPGAGFETEQRTALRGIVQANTEAWGRDPLGHAAQLGLIDPVVMPDPASDSDNSLAGSVRARLAQAVALAEQGYTAAPVLLRPDERAAFSAVTGVAADPRDRVRVAADLVAALGDDAPALIGQFSEDPVFGYVGGMVSATGNTQLATQIFEGQRAAEANDVPLPSVSARRSLWFEAFGGQGGVLADFADSGLRDQIIGAADALTVYRLRGADPSSREPDALRDIWLQSAHEAMGGSGRYNGRDARGGVQSVNGAMTILPMGVSGTEVTSQLARLASAMDQTWTADGPTIHPIAMEALRGVSVDGRLPSLGGEPLDGYTLRSLVFRPTPDGFYNAFLDGRDLQITNEQGEPWRLDLDALVRWQP